MCEKLAENDVKELIMKQIEFREKDGESIFEHRFRVKNWCITLLAGIFAFVVTHKDDFGTMGEQATAAFLFFALAPIFFWFVEAMYAGTARLQGEILKKSVEQLGNNDFNPDNLKRIFWDYQFKKLKSEHRHYITFMDGAFILTVVGFYYPLLIVSLFAVAWIYKLCSLKTLLFPIILVSMPLFVWGIWGFTKTKLKLERG